MERLLTHKVDANLTGYPGMCRVHVNVLHAEISIRYFGLNGGTQRSDNIFLGAFSGKEMQGTIGIQMSLYKH